MKKVPLLLIMIALAITGCGGGDASDVPPNNQSGDPVNFIRRRQPSGAGMGAELTGQLALINKCLKIGGFTAIWPYEFDYTVQGEVVNIINENDEVAARTNDEVSVAGGEIPSLSAEEWGSYVTGDPIQCGGPYWSVSGSVEIVKAK